MKKIIFTLLAAVMTLSASAQVIQIYKTTDGITSDVATYTNGTDTYKAILRKTEAAPLVKSITLTSSNGASIYEGASTTMSVGTVTPEGASNTVTWLVSPSEAGVTITEAGVVTATTTATRQDYTITAIATDGSNVSGTYTLAVTADPNLLSGTFTVDKSGKKVKFTKGNLYYSTTDSKYHLESTQNATYGTGSGTYAGTHVYHFFWSNITDWQTSGKEPWASSYSYSSQSTSDKFFCGKDNKMIVDGTEGLYALTGGMSGEWYYLFSSRTNASNLYKIGVTVTIGDKKVTNCLVIAPDDYTGTIESSYDATAWATAEAAGLVCLPAAGSCKDSSLSDGGSYGYYWSASPYLGKVYCASDIDFKADNVFVANCRGRGLGSSVRLVK